MRSICELFYKDGHNPDVIELIIGYLQTIQELCLQRASIEWNDFILIEHLNETVYHNEEISRYCRYIKHTLLVDASAEFFKQNGPHKEEQKNQPYLLHQFKSNRKEAGL